jgi:hypothetical protein
MKGENCELVQFINQTIYLDVYETNAIWNEK